MSTDTILLLVVSLGLAIAVTYYQYYYKAKKKSRLTFFLAFLRFLVFALIGLLLINPKIKSKTYQVIKPIITVAYDNSSSIAELKEESAVNKIKQQITSHLELNERFDVRQYQFSDEINILDSLSFTGKQSAIYKVGSYFKKSPSKTTIPTLLVSDGNQTFGVDYKTSFALNQKVYPIVIGDTLQPIDVAVQQINVNDYVLEGNQFPVEAFVQYQGDKPIKTTLSIVNKNKQTVYKQQLELSADNNSQIIEAILPSGQIGVNVYTVVLSSLNSEKNKVNNRQQFAIEVINQKTKIAIISSIKHPDVGVLKRAITSNELREVSIITPAEYTAESKYDLVLIYQPNATFKTIFDSGILQKSNYWMVTGNNTDYSFLSNYIKDYQIQSTNQTEEFLPLGNEQFSSFALSDDLFATFPPLKNKFITASAKAKEEVVLYAKVGGVNSGMTLLSFIESANSRHAYLFGEGIWQWRMASYKQDKNFESFDLFVDQLVQYLTTDRKKDRLKVVHKKLYTTSSPIEITAQFYDKNYNLDGSVALTASVINKETKEQFQYEMTRKNTNYTVFFDNLVPGEYNFTIEEKESNTKYSNRFSVIDSDMESYFVSANLKGLSVLAKATDGAVYYPNQVETLIQKLMQDPSYKPIQKEIVRTISLIDWYYILGMIALLLAIEWFVRKYNGLL